MTPPGVRIAAERAIAINPLNTGTVAVCGMFLAYSGAWERGLEVLRRRCSRRRTPRRVD